MIYMNNYFGFQQPNLERVNRQIEELQNIRNQIQSNQPPMIQQNFMQQAFHSDFDAKWIENKNEINNIPVTRDSIFMDKNNPIFYLKDVNGNIKAYDFTEHIEKDEKDIEIEKLKKEIEDLKKEMSKDESVIQPKTKSKSNVDDK